MVAGRLSGPGALRCFVGAGLGELADGLTFESGPGVRVLLNYLASEPS
jgi:hypothetical protein